MTAAKVQAITATIIDLSSSVTSIPIELLNDAPWNARKTYDEGLVAQMAATLKDHGQLVPLIVRRIDEHAFEIVAGHRRFRAAQKLGWSSLRCEVRDLTEDQAREIGLVDNLQREDVPALEEAEAYAELRKRLGTPEAIAARVGKDVSYVARRLQLISLAELPRQALAERLIAIDHALLLARVAEEEQNAALKWCLDPNAGQKTAVEDVIRERIKRRDAKSSWSGYWEPQSVKKLKAHIEEDVGRQLNRAPWKLDDAELLPDAGACNACPSNTKANTNLFADLNISAATCENGRCFEAKRAAFVQITLTEATHKQAEGPNAAMSAEPAVRLSFRATTVKPRVDKKTGAISLQQTFKAGQWVEAKPGSCAYVRLGVTVDWSDDGNRGYMGRDEKLRKPGLILNVCIAEKCKVHKKEWEKAKGSGQGSGVRGQKAEAEREAKLKAEAIEESKLRLAVASAAVEAIKKIPADVVRAMAIGCAPEWGVSLKAAEAILPSFKKTLKTAKADGTEFAKAVAVASIQNLVASEWRGAVDGRDTFLASVKRLGWTGPDPWKKPAPAKAAKEPAKKAAVKKATKKGGRK